MPRKKKQMTFSLVGPLLIRDGVRKTSESWIDNGDTPGSNDVIETFRMFGFSITADMEIEGNKPGFPVAFEQIRENGQYFCAEDHASLVYFGLSNLCEALDINIKEDDLYVIADTLDDTAHAAMERHNATGTEFSTKQPTVFSKTLN